MHDHPTTTQSPGASARRGWFRRRHQPEAADTVNIGGDASHSWWADRDEVSAAASTRRAQERLATRPSPAAAAAAAAFAPASGAAGGSEPTEAWDTDALFAWADTTVDSVDQTGDVAARSPWEVLGLNPDVPWMEVVRRHRLLVKRLHPDLHNSAETDVRREIELRMAQVNAAFDDLESVYGMSKGA